MTRETGLGAVLVGTPFLCGGIGIAWGWAAGLISFGAVFVLAGLAVIAGGRRG